MYNQVHQERIVATVQPHVIGQEIPQLPIVEWIQEQIDETIEVVPQERVEVQMNTSSTSTSNTIPVIERVTLAPVVTFTPLIEYVSEDACGWGHSCSTWRCPVQCLLPTPAVQQIVAEESIQDLVAAPVCAGDIGFDTCWEQQCEVLRVSDRRHEGQLRVLHSVMKKTDDFRSGVLDSYSLFPAQWQTRVYPPPHLL